MTELIAIPKIAQWQKLKMLVLDSVSSLHQSPVVNSLTFPLSREWRATEAQSASAYLDQELWCLILANGSAGFATRHRLLP